MRFDTFWTGFGATILMLWVVIFFAGPAIDDLCVITKTGEGGLAVDKRGHVISYPRHTRLVKKECSEFSRLFFLRDVEVAKSLRKAVGAQ